MADIAHLDDIWTKFLELLPVENVRAMTLEQYVFRSVPGEHDGNAGLYLGRLCIQIRHLPAG